MQSATERIEHAAVEAIRSDLSRDVRLRDHFALKVELAGHPLSVPAHALVMVRFGCQLHRSIPRKCAIDLLIAYDGLDACDGIQRSLPQFAAQLRAKVAHELPGADLETR